MGGLDPREKGGRRRKGEGEKAIMIICIPLGFIFTNECSITCSNYTKGGWQQKNDLVLCQLGSIQHITKHYILSNHDSKSLTCNTGYVAMEKSKKQETILRHPQHFPPSPHTPEGRKQTGDIVRSSWKQTNTIVSHSSLNILIGLCNFLRKK